MSNIRDAIADDYVDNHLSGERVAHIKYLDEQLERDTFCAGWQSALKNAPEVLALVEALAKCRDEAYDLASELSNTEETQAYQTADRLADLASSALTQWKESTTKKREE